MNPKSGATMPIDFPNSPIVGDTFSSGDKTWEWDGTTWNLVLGTPQIGTSAVTTAKIANSAVTSAKLALNAVTETSIANSAVTSNKLAANAVITASISDNAVTQAKMADRAIGSAELDNMTLNAQTGTTYTLALTDAHKLVTLNNASGITVTIPTNASVAFEIGDQINLLQLGLGQVTVSPAVGVTMNSSGSKTKLFGQYAIGTLVKVATNGWVFLGNIAV